MLRLFLGREFSAGDASRDSAPRFRPRLEALGDRINPAISFAPQQPLAVGAVPADVAVGDFDMNGQSDFVTGNGGATGTVSLFVRTAGGSSPTFTVSAPRNVGGPVTRVAVADLNSDGRDDIIAVSQSAGTVTVLLNQAVPGMSLPPFAAPRTFAAGVDPFAVAVGDFTGDGRPDIAVTNHGPSLSHTVTILANTTAMRATVPSFAAARSFEAGALPAGLATGDFNGDGRLDLVAANQSGTVSVLLNTTPPTTAGATAPTFAAPQSHAAGPRPRAVTVADFDGNGLPDVAVANEFAAPADSLATLLNGTVHGSFTVTFGGDAGHQAGVGQAAVVAADLNGDGAADVATANSTDGTVSVLQIQRLAGGFSPGNITALGVGPSPTGLAAGDFTGDGLPDLVTANGDGTVSVLVNTSAQVGRPVLVGSFGDSGAWVNDPIGANGWRQLVGTVDPGVPNLVAASGTRGVAVSVAGRGIWLDGRRITTASATALAFDSAGNVWAAFAGAGVAVYRPHSGVWAGLPGTSATADNLAVSANGDVIADFVGFGVYRYRSGAGWRILNGHSATTLAVDANGFVAASFAGFGVGQYIPFADGWRSLAHRGATAITVSDAGVVYASFDESGGISRWSASAGAWVPVAYSAPAVSLAADLFGRVHGAFPGYGVMGFTPGVGWQRLRETDASSLSLGRLPPTDNPPAPPPPWSLG